MTADRGEIRIQDHEGRLQTAGYVWGEKTSGPLFYAILAVVFGLLGFGAMMNISGRVNFGATLFFLAATGIFFGLAVLFFKKSADSKGNPRGVLFHADGRIELPYGLPRQPDIRILAARWPEVASISAERDDVAIYLRDGDKVWLTQPRRYETEHKISVQLQHALAAIRDAVADASMPRRAPSPDTPVVID